jgi:hypothetical protein
MNELSRHPELSTERLGMATEKRILVRHADSRLGTPGRRH